MYSAPLQNSLPAAVADTVESESLSYQVPRSLHLHLGRILNQSVEFTTILGGHNLFHYLAFLYPPWIAFILQAPCRLISLGALHVFVDMASGGADLRTEGC